ncbi:hypothetical protein DPMN_061509 [Dreissena polymorpha]|uniref:Tripartite motif-containing protein 2 n=1 Tax=Dreissena polymorpha TaxID=45954 RepID=A0A9D4C759_DREPO|nr:hypothetical protein DPMN_061509 [Dreissena polymorpha]
MTLTFKPDSTIQQTLSTLSGLGQILSTVRQSQPVKRTTRTTDSRQTKPKETSQSDPGHQTTSGFKVNKPNPESSTSRTYSPENGTSDLTKSGQVSDPVSNSSDQLVQGYQPGAVTKSDQIIKVKSSKKYSVKNEGENDSCYIGSICETASGELLITDWTNDKVKLLDQTYKVVAHCDLPGPPVSMCSIDSSLAAVTMLPNEVHFIRVTNGQLIKDRVMELKHACLGIAHQHGNLYITNGRALYQYTLDGRLVRELCDLSGQWTASPDGYIYSTNYETVTSCAVSPDGDRIYVTNQDSKQVVTLSRDGTVISTLTDPALDFDKKVLPGLHVTDSGQVLVCGNYTNTIVQVDRDGRQRLTEVVTENDGVTYPMSVYYSKHTGSLIVGMMFNSDIIVFKTQ